MTQKKLIELNVLCSLYFLELPAEIVQIIYTEYIIDNKQKIEILYKLYNKYKYKYKCLYHTFSICIVNKIFQRHCYNRYRPLPHLYHHVYCSLNKLYIDILYSNGYPTVRYYRNWQLILLLQKEEKRYKKENKKDINNKYTKKNTYYQNKARLKLKNY